MATLQRQALERAEVCRLFQDKLGEVLENRSELEAKGRIASSLLKILEEEGLLDANTSNECASLPLGWNSW